MTLQGRLTRDPEFRQTQNGTAVASFTVAWSEKYKETERKLFLPCVAWGNSALFVCQYFVKGSEIIVEGGLTSRKWQDKDGNNRESIELTVERMHFAGSKTDSAPQDAPEPTGNPTNAPAGFAPAVDDDQLPF
jgi:single-strand DNA-binding protein